MTSSVYEDFGRKHAASRWVIAAVLLVAGAALIILLVYQAETPGREDVRAYADDAAYQLERTPVPGLGLDAWDVQRALADGTRDNRGRSAMGLRVNDAGTDSRGELFEITNRRGQYPVCLVVNLPSAAGAQPVFPTVEVTDGPCTSS